MQQPSVTLKQVLAWNPCKDYPESRLVELAAGRDSITALEVLELPIPDVDKLWMLDHDELTHWKQRRYVACDLLDLALKAYPHPEMERINNRHRVGLDTDNASSLGLWRDEREMLLELHDQFYSPQRFIASAMIQAPQRDALRWVGVYYSAAMNMVDGGASNINPVVMQVVRDAIQLKPWPFSTELTRETP